MGMFFVLFLVPVRLMTVYLQHKTREEKYMIRLEDSKERGEKKREALSSCQTVRWKRYLLPPSDTNYTSSAYCT